jgi:tRNA(Ile)-lysidine synthase
MSNLTLDDSLDAGQAMAVLDQHLHGRAGKPVAVGFSGGGDSLFLLKMAVDWGRRHHRPVLAITVDHRLQPESRDWVSWCADKAWALGADFVGRAWEGPKPDTGLSAAARRARHELLAQETRRVGASVLLLGQTLDDLFEAELMALEGSSVGMPRTWSPSPVWPEGREVFLLRPLLSLRRAAIRRELVRENWQWIDDPANESAVSLRARARSRLARDPSMQDLSVSALPPLPTPPAQVSGGASGGLELNWPISPTVLGMACLSAGGGSCGKNWIIVITFARPCLVRGSTRPTGKSGLSAMPGIDFEPMGSPSTCRKASPWFGTADLPSRPRFQALSYKHLMDFSGSSATLNEQH